MSSDHVDLFLDEANFAVGAPAGSIRLTPAEFRLLAHLLDGTGEVVNRADLLAVVLAHGIVMSDAAFDECIETLQRKLARSGSSRSLEVAPPFGYRLS